MSLFNKNSISSKINLGYVIVIACAIFTSIATIYTLQSNRKIDGTLTNVYLPVLNLSKDFKVLVLESKKLSNNWVYMPNNEEKQRLKQIFDNDFPTLDSYIGNYIKSNNLQDSIRISLEEKGLGVFSEIIKSTKEITSVLSTDDAYADDAAVDKAISIFQTKISSPSDELIKNLDLLISYVQKCVKKTEDEKANSFKILTLLMVLSLLIIVIVSIGFSYYTSKNVTKPIIDLKEVILMMGKGHVKSDHNIFKNRQDEIGEMANAIRNLTDGLLSKSEFAEEIGKGNYQKDFQLLSEADIMGKSLLQMRDSLKINSENERKRNWATLGIAQLGDILRKSNIDEHTLFSDILKYIIKYTGSNQGGLFILKNDSDEVELELVASYAYERVKFLHKIIKPGEGLIGQCYLERDRIFLTEVPDNYVNITSGLGESTPRCILIMPLKLNEDVLGVLELATFKVFEDYEIEFVQKIAETIASSVSSIKINNQTKKLLQESQHKEEQLRSQEEEMRQNMEELQATQEEIQRKEKSYIAEIEALRAKLS